MFSWNTVHETLGDARFAERAELIAYNALPGSMTKVRRGVVVCIWVGCCLYVV